MESSVCGFSISNVRSIAEDGMEANGTWSVKLQEEFNSDKTIDDFASDDTLSVTEPQESDKLQKEFDSNQTFKDKFACEDTLSVTELQVEVEYSDVTLEYCGLSSLDMLKALYAYVEDEIEPLEGATKFTQLFSVLTNLHTNQESIYLNKYIFPSAFVQIIELLYRKLKVLCKISTPWNKLPDIFVPTFTRDQRLIIVGVITLHISNNQNVFKYLIGYSAFGEVFFVSNSFKGFPSIGTLIQFSGILEELQPEEWILYFRKKLLYMTQVKCIKSTVSGSRVKSRKIKKYVTSNNSKLEQHFRILSQPFLESMLFSEGDICFLDKLIFVCSMLLNLLPRKTYC